MSTPTTSLQLQQITTGDQSGTWGTSTNTNMQLIDDSIAGVTSITFDGINNYVLSNISYASDEARKMVIIANGSPGTANKIVAPLVTKFYVVVNRTNTTIIIGASTGATVSIPYTATPSSMIVYCDGTDFKPASNSTSGTFTSDIFSGAGTGLTGTASALSIGGNAATATLATKSTNIAGGATGNLPYQTAADTTGFLGLGTNGYILTAGSTAPQYTNPASLSIGTATNLAGGSAGYIPYQTSSGTTSFLSLGTTNYVLTAGASAPQYVAQSTLSVGNSAQATNLNNGSAGQIVYQTGANTTGFLALGTTNYVLTAGGSAPQYVAQSTLSVGSATTATTSTNIAGGAAGSIVYQTGSGATSTLGLGTTNYVLTAGASAPQYVAQSTLSVGSATTATTATNLASGTANQIPYQTSSGSTSFIAAPTLGVTYLAWNGTNFSWATAGSSTTTNSVTFNNGGAGAVSGTAFNNSANVTVSYNTIGASPLAGSTSLTTVGTIGVGTWQGSPIQPSYVATLNQNTTGTAGGLSGTPNITVGTVNGTTITASSQFSGPGTGLTGTASGLSIGGNATTATSATNATNLVSGGSIASNVTATTQTTSDNSTKVATTAYVKSVLPATPDSYLKLVYSGVVNGGNLTPYGSGGYTHVWDILFASGAQAREMVSPDSFTVVTSVNDYYYNTSTATYNNYTITKTVNLSDNSFDTRLTLFFSFSGYPNPNQINVKIYVQSATAVTSLTFIS
jgi:hypothetical protein